MLLRYIPYLKLIIKLQQGVCNLYQTSLRPRRSLPIADTITLPFFALNPFVSEGQVFFPDRRAEAERERLTRTLEATPKPNGSLPAVLPDLQAWFKQSLGEMAQFGPHEVDKARGIIKDLVGGSIPLKPVKTSQGPALAAIIRPDYAGLARQLAGPKIILVAVTRIERVTRGL